VKQPPLLLLVRSVLMHIATCACADAITSAAENAHTSDDDEKPKSSMDIINDIMSSS
jgi:hypothetical protein